MLQVIFAIVAFGLLVIVHEFGHFITAKRGGVQVNEFWIGMGPTLLSKEWHGTKYCLKLLPFGGACVMEGEDGDYRQDAEQAGAPLDADTWDAPKRGKAFPEVRLRRRMLIVVAGALMNFLVGFLILLAVTTPNGPSGGYIVATIDEIDARSTVAGILEPGDDILSIDGYHIFERMDFEVALSRGADTRYDVTVRRDGRRLALTDVPFEATIEGEDGRKLIGLTFAEQAATPLTRIEMAGRASVSCARLVWTSLGMLISGQVGVDQLSGPVGVAAIMADTARVSMSNFFYLVAFISINLGVMNLLPLPALDGGRLVFLILEGIRRKPVPAKYEGWVHAAGLLLLLALMVLVTGQDILRLLTGGYAG